MVPADSERNSQMEILRPSERPENKFPIGQLSFAYDSQMPDGFQECLDITKPVSRLIILTGPVVPEKRQNPFMIVSGRIDRAYYFLITFEKIFDTHFRHKVY